MLTEDQMTYYDNATLMALRLDRWREDWPAPRPAPGRIRRPRGARAFQWAWLRL